MPYCLTREESIAGGIRRIVRKEVDSAVAQLRAQGIHEARKSIKKLRGIVRLLMPHLGERGRRENIALRDAGRTLSEFRDAAAMLETIDALSAKHPETDLSPLRELLVKRKNEAERRSEIATVARQATSALRSFKRRVNTWPIDSDAFSTLAPGLRQAYRAGRKALARARKHPTAGNFHELRKRAKDHWYHVRFLENLRAEFPGDREKSLKDMQEWLGDDHNLDVLRRTMKAELVPPVRDLISHRQKELRGNAVSAGARLFEEKPRDHVRGLRERWDAWRG